MNMSIPSNPFNKKHSHRRINRLMLMILFTAIIAVWIMLASGFVQRKNEKKQPNVIVICVDSLRADHLGCYGYRRQTSPRIDALARTGVLFEHAFSNSSYTRESVSVILSGLLPSVSGSTGLLAVPREDNLNMGEYFSKAGYRTGFFSASSNLDTKEFNQGFTSVYIDNKKNNRNSSDLSARVIKFIEENKEQKFMMYLHYLDPHNPYDPTMEFYQRFSPVVYDNPVDLKEEMRTQCKDWIKDGFGPGEPRYEDMILRYDAEIADTDKAIGQVIDNLKELELLDNTVIVITADHGEEFLEHGYVVHAWTLFKESVHVPLIFWGGPFSTPKRIADRVSSVDILPTLLSTLEIPFDSETMDGESLFELPGKTATFKPPARPYIGELILQHRNIVRAVVKKHWKYLSYVLWTEPENRPRHLAATPAEIAKNPRYQVDPWSPIQYEALFDLRSDPLEKINLLHSRPVISDEMREILAQYKIRCQAIQREKNNSPAQQPSLQDLEKLKSLGYL